MYQLRQEREFQEELNELNWDGTVKGSIFSYHPGFNVVYDRVIFGMIDRKELVVEKDATLKINE